MKLFALAEGQLAFGAIAAEINLQRDQGEAALLGSACQFIKLAAVEEKLARAHGIVIPNAAGAVFGNVGVHEPEFAGARLGVGLAEGGLAFAEGFDFGADQNDAGFDFVEEDVVVRGGAILGDDADAVLIAGVLGLGLVCIWPLRHDRI